MKKEDLANAEESKDDDHMDTLINSTNTFNTASTHLQKALDISAECSSNL